MTLVPTVMIILSQSFRFSIPFIASALVRLPFAESDAIAINGQSPSAIGIKPLQIGDETQLELVSGNYSIAHAPTRSYVKRFSSRTPLVELLLNPEARETFSRLLPIGMELNADSIEVSIGDATLHELSPYYPMDEEMLNQLDFQLKKI